MCRVISFVTFWLQFGQPISSVASPNIGRPKRSILGE